MAEVELTTKHIFQHGNMSPRPFKCMFIFAYRTMSGCPQHWAQATEVFLYGQRLVLATDLPHHRHHQQQPLLSLSPQSKIHRVKHQVSNLLLCACFLAGISLQKSKGFLDYALLILLWCVGSHSLGLRHCVTGAEDWVGAVVLWGMGGWGGCVL